MGRSGGSPFIAVADSTPGIPESFPCTACQNRWTLAVSGYNACGRFTRNVSRPSARNPGCTSLSFQNARIMSPVPISSTSASASSLATITERNRFDITEPAARPAAALSAS